MKLWIARDSDNTYGYTQRNLKCTPIQKLKATFGFLPKITGKLMRIFSPKSPSRTARWKLNLN